ncbi:MAG: hypothetical protein AB1458_14975 [Bacteroidota bacterium]
MKKIFFNILAYLLLIVSALVSCKKEEGDGNAPFITIYNPVENQFVNVFDTLIVNADVNDDKNLESVSVTLVNENLVPVQASVAINVNDNFVSFSQAYIIYDIHLVSGVYYIKVSASDGLNTISSYRKINVIAAPRKVMGYYLITNPNVNNMLISSIDTGFSAINPYFNYGGDFSAAAISAYNQELYTSGHYSGSANAVSLTTGGIRWSVPSIPGSDPYFKGIINQDKTTYLAYFNGLVRGFNSNGAIVFNGNISAGYYPLKLFKHAAYIICSEKSITGAFRKIIVLQGETGAGMQEALMSQDVVEFFTKDSDNVFVFGNSSGQGVIEIYQVSTNGFWSPHTLVPGVLLSAEQVDSDTYLIGHSNGTVYKYIYSTNSSTPFITGVMARNIEYDDINQEIIITDGSAVKKYSYGNGGLLGTLTAPDSIFDLHVLYNH